ncbi:MAG: U32 family peptidase, partial [Clostridia bacterium]|nr:U32 family peptidase [Clostridia bacterium]
MRKLPELLAPAGTPEALAAALDAGADAVYFGGTDFNARLRAANFTPDAMREAVKLCHAFGAKAYLTLNTLVTDRELPRAVEVAKEAYLCGIDALIVADLGAAAAIHEAIPDFELHASTQCAGHNAAAAAELSKLGFSRMVIARESSKADMQHFLAESELELEVFVHGALCVSHSGQCLFSSLVGGRSGNRGECAQPCRLPDARGKYPLSLKDLSLAEHVPELIEMGVHSLKIEGRLKSPEY